MEDFNELSYQTPLYSIRARGKWRDKVVFEVRGTKQYHRVLTDYDRGAKACLKPFQSKFSAAVWSWRNLTDENKRWYHSRAAKLGLQISGFNYYISLYLRGKLGDDVGYPDPHKLSHQEGGADEIDLTGLTGISIMVQRIEEAEVLILEDFEQLFIADFFELDGTSSLALNGSAMLAIE